MEKVLVVLIKESVVCDTWLFIGTNDAVKEAEKQFISVCRENAKAETEDFTDDEIIDEGYITFGVDCSVCLTHVMNVKLHGVMMR